MHVPSDALTTPSLHRISIHPTGNIDLDIVFFILDRVLLGPADREVAEDAAQSRASARIRARVRRMASSSMIAVIALALFVPRGESRGLQLHSRTLPHLSQEAWASSLQSVPSTQAAIEQAQSTTISTTIGTIGAPGGGVLIDLRQAPRNAATGDATSGAAAQQPNVSGLTRVQPAAAGAKTTSGSGVQLGGFVMSGRGGASMQLVNPSTARLVPVRQAPSRSNCVVYTVSAALREGCWASMFQCFVACVVQRVQEQR